LGGGEIIDYRLLIIDYLVEIGHLLLGLGMDAGGKKAEKFAQAISKMVQKLKKLLQ